MMTVTWSCEPNDPFSSKLLCYGIFFITATEDKTKVDFKGTRAPCLLPFVVGVGWGGVGFQDTAELCSV